MIDLDAELKGTYEILSAPKGFKNMPANFAKDFIESSADSVIESSTAPHFTLTFMLVPQTNWTYFHGHFPAQPILPAVGIADISRYFVEKYIFKTKRNLKKTSQFRIRTPVQPGQKMQVTIEKDNENQFHITWKNETENSNSAELNLEWA